MFKHSFLRIDLYYNSNTPSVWGRNNKCDYAYICSVLTHGLCPLLIIKNVCLYTNVSWSMPLSILLLPTLVFPIRYRRFSLSDPLIMKKNDRSMSFVLFNNPLHHVVQILAQNRCTSVNKQAVQQAKIIREHNSMGPITSPRLNRHSGIELPAS